MKATSPHALLALQVKALGRGMNAILALDCATSTGWAIGKRSPTLGWFRFESGTQVFDVRRGESPGLRFLRFRNWLDEMRARCAPDLLVFERAHHRGGAATELCVGFTTRAQEIAAAHGIEYAGVPTGTLKKHVTGKGSAGKPEMIAAAAAIWGHQPATDDEADALCLLKYATDNWG